MSIKTISYPKNTIYNYIFLWVLIISQSTALAMQQEAIEGDCSICREKLASDGQPLVYGNQLFKTPPCGEKHIHHDVCMASLLHVGKLRTGCPLCRAVLNDTPSEDLAPLSRAILLFIKGKTVQEIYCNHDEVSAQKLFDSAMAAGIDLPKPPIAQFFDAVHVGDIASTQELIAQGINSNILEPISGKTALIIAAETNNAALVKMLIAAGADCNIRDQQQYSALMYAARNGYTEVACTLFTYGQLIPEQNIDALYMGYRFQSILELFKQKCGIDSWIIVSTPLIFMAARDGVESVIRHLIAPQCSHGLSYIDSKGFSPLMYAARHGHRDLVHFLVDHGDEVLLWNHEGMTAQKLALAHGHPEIAEFLAQHEPQRPRAGAPLADFLLFAARTRDYETVQQIITEHPLLINMRDKEGITPLMCAVLADDTKLAHFLIEHGANTAARDYHNCSSALALAIEFKKPDLVRLLIEKAHVEFSVLDCDADSCRPEDFARSFDFEEIVPYLAAQRIIRESSVVPEQENDSLGYILREAASCGDIELVQDIVQRYPDVIN